MRYVKGMLPLVVILILVASCQRDLILENKPPVVNPGTDTTFDFEDSSLDSIRLSGSATDADGTVTGYLWSQKSGPNTAKILNPGSPDTYVSNLASGVYIFQLMATDDKGATGIRSVSITIIKPDVFTLTLQPANSSFDRHLLILGTTDQSDATAPEIGASAWTNNGVPFSMRALLKFDLSTLPANAKIKSAKLTLYSNPTPINSNQVDANFGDDNSLFISRAIDNWNSSVTWQTQPLTTASGQISVPHTDQSLLDLVELDVTNLIKDMQQHGNYGFLIRLQNEVIYTARIFCSSKYADASKHPKLVLEYD